MIDIVAAWLRAHPSLIGGAVTLIMFWALVEATHLLLRWAFEPSCRRRK